jgi:hypothetical protein
MRRVRRSCNINGFSGYASERIQARQVGRSKSDATRWLPEGRGRKSAAPDA